MSDSTAMPAPAASTLIVGDDASAEKAISHLIEVLSSATESQAADILSFLDRGMALWAERKEAACPGSSERTPILATPSTGTPAKSKAKKEKEAPAAPKKAKKAAAAELPSASAGAPEASEYRIDPSSIDETVCVARSLKDGEDKRFKPAIYRESQCGKKQVEGSDLCAICEKREALCAENPAKPGHWNGRITEEPGDWVHMLGTAWAAKARFVGSASAPASASASASASDAGSVAEAEEEAESEAESVAVAAAPENASSEEKKMPVAKKPATDKVTDKAAAAAAAKATKEAEKAASKAAKDAEKAAAKAAKDAEKAAEKAAAAAAKEATKAAKDAEKAAAKEAKAAKPAKAEKPKAAAKAAKPDAKISTTAEPVVVEGAADVIDGTCYWIKNGNVYEYDEVTDTIGAFSGRRNADGTIDTEAEEVGAAESDAE
jgi:hypothetical protein